MGTLILERVANENDCGVPPPGNDAAGGNMHVLPTPPPPYSGIQRGERNCECCQNRSSDQPCCPNLSLVLLPPCSCPVELPPPVFRRECGCHFCRSHPIFFFFLFRRWRNNKACVFGCGWNHGCNCGIHQRDECLHCVYAWPE